MFWLNKRRKPDWHRALADKYGTLRHQASNQSHHRTASMRQPGRDRDGNVAVMVQRNHRKVSARGPARDHKVALGVLSSPKGDSIPRSGITLPAVTRMNARFCGFTPEKYRQKYRHLARCPRMTSCCYFQYSLFRESPRSTRLRSPAGHTAECSSAIDRDFSISTGHGGVRSDRT